MVRPWLKLLDPGLTALKERAGAAFDERLGLARALNGRGRHAEAREILEGLLAEDRAHSETWFERLLCHGDDAPEEEGIELLSQLESLRDESPKNSLHLRNLGYLRLLLQDPDGAEMALQQSLAIEGQDRQGLGTDGSPEPAPWAHCGGQGLAAEGSEPPAEGSPYPPAARHRPGADGRLGWRRDATGGRPQGR